MINSKGERELAYLVQIDNIESIIGSDNCESAVVGGWHVLVSKGEFKPNDFAVYFEIDSQLPDVEPFSSMKFLASKHFKIKTQKFTFGGKGNFVSQGLLMPMSAWTDSKGMVPAWVAAINLYIASGNDILKSENRFLTKDIGVTYATTEDNLRKSKYIDNSNKAKCQRLMAQHQKFAKSKIGRWCAKRPWVVNFLYNILGCRKAATAKSWPDGRFEGVKRTDQERAENLTWILNDKTPFIVTQKCDGSSGTYILERKKHNKFEFYVCSRNVRMASKEQECFYGEHNYYWEVADKYNIEEKMRQWLNAHPKATFVCWQGEICAPGIQGNPHHLKETHFYCFHWTDSLNGRRDIREAVKDWRKVGMETVPVVDVNYIMPDNFEDFKKSADGNYDASVCEGNKNCMREGFVYYKTTEPTFSFKNVSREYLLEH